MDNNKIILTDDEGNKEEFYIIEQTKFDGVNYILVTENENEETGESDAFILRETSPEDAACAVYEFEEDEARLEALADIFAELLDGEADII